jgi:hypothetical protein
MDLQLPLRMQECRPLTPQDAGMILLSRGMRYPFICQSQQSVNHLSNKEGIKETTVQISIN